MSEETKTTVTKEQLLTFSQNFQEKVRIYCDLLTSPETINSFKPSKVDDPIAELNKISVLIHSNVTKLGLVFKYPFDSDNNCGAGLFQLKEYGKLFELLMSLSVQVFQKSKNKYSELFLKEILENLKILTGLTLSIGKTVENVISNKDNNKDRVLLVGKIWKQSEDLQTILKQGEIPILISQLNKSIEMVNDAMEDLSDWIENNENDDDDDDPFGLNDFSDSEDELDEQVKEKIIDPEFDEKKLLGEKWLNKLKLLKNYYSIFIKALNLVKKQNLSLKNNELNEVNKNQSSLIEKIDDLVSSFLMKENLKQINENIEDLTNNFKNFQNNLNDFIIVKIGKHDNLIKLQKSWNERFLAN